MTQISYQENWGISSAGRAPALQAGGRRFDPVILHQLLVHVYQHQRGFVRGYFVVDQDLLINRLFFKNS